VCEFFFFFFTPLYRLKGLWWEQRVLLLFALLKSIVSIVLVHGIKVKWNANNI
jgi:hypothetical protein